jgi:hypothetical protein
MNDYDNPTKQYGCYYQQQFRKPLNKSDPNSDSVRASTWAAYLNGTSRTNLQILDSATVLKLVFDENEPTKCTGVVYEYKGQIYTVRAKKRSYFICWCFRYTQTSSVVWCWPKRMDRTI